MACNSSYTPFALLWAHVFMYLCLFTAFCYNSGAHQTTCRGETKTKIYSIGHDVLCAMLMPNVIQAIGSSEHRADSSRATNNERCFLFGDTSHYDRPFVRRLLNYLDSVEQMFIVSVLAITNHSSQLARVPPFLAISINLS